MQQRLSNQSLLLHPATELGFRLFFTKAFGLSIILAFGFIHVKVFSFFEESLLRSHVLPHRHFLNCKIPIYLFFKIDQLTGALPDGCEK